MAILGWLVLVAVSVGSSIVAIAAFMASCFFVKANR